MKITMLTIGSTGDVRPYVLLGRELKARGHDITIAAFSGFEKLIAENGLKYYPLSGDVMKLMANVMKPGVNKGRAMQMLQSIKGISPDKCMAFGDYLNDWELLQSVTESYAMENALPELKAIAKHIAPPNDDDGVMRVVKECFGV